MVPASLGASFFLTCFLPSWECGAVLRASAQRQLWQPVKKTIFFSSRPLYWAHLDYKDSDSGFFFTCF